MSAMMRAAGNELRDLIPSIGEQRINWRGILLRFMRKNRIKTDA